MKSNCISAVLLLISVNSVCWADGYEVEFMAGNTSIEGGVHYDKELSGGFFKIGGSGLYTNDEDPEITLPIKLVQAFESFNMHRFSKNIPPLM